MDITLRDVIIMAVSLALALLLMSGCGKKVLHSTPPSSGTSKKVASSPETVPSNDAGRPAPAASIPSAESVDEKALSDDAPSATATVSDPGPVTAPDVYEEEGLASWYGAKFHGKHTASGEVFDAGKFTAAHRVLPFGSMVEVTNLENGERVVVRINDRGPFEDMEHRIIDLSRASAESVGMGSKGLIKVRIRRVDSGAEAGVLAPVAAVDQPVVETEDAPPALPGAVAVESAAGNPGQATAQATEKMEASAQPAAVQEEAVLVDTKEEWITADSGGVVVEAVEETTVAAMETSQPAAASASGKYFVQVGAFTDGHNANKVLADLRAKGYPGSRIVSVDRDGKRFMRVQAGPFNGRGEAEGAAARLKNAYPNSLVTY